MNEAIPLEDRLEILRAADTHQKWHSLDDKRICVLCDRVMTGRQIEIVCERSGRFLLHCPSENCASTINDWFYQPDPLPAAPVPEGLGRKTAEVDFSNW